MMRRDDRDEDERECDGPDDVTADECAADGCFWCALAIAEAAIERAIYAADERRAHEKDEGRR